MNFFRVDIRYDVRWHYDAVIYQQVCNIPSSTIISTASLPISQYEWPKKKRMTNESSTQKSLASERLSYRTVIMLNICYYRRSCPRFKFNPVSFTMASYFRIISILFLSLSSYFRIKSKIGGYSDRNRIEIETRTTSAIITYI